MYLKLKVGDIIQATDEFKSTSGQWCITPIDNTPIIDNGVEWRRPVICGCQEGLIGTQHCPIHGEDPIQVGQWCQCSYPTTDHVTQSSGTCGQCGKIVRLYNETYEQATIRLGHVTATDRAVLASYPTFFDRIKERGCWFCQKTDGEMLFCFEFDTNLHEKCLIEAVKRERHQETMIIFREVYLGEHDELLEPGQVCSGRCFELSEGAHTDMMTWFEIESPELQGRHVLPGELIIREKQPCKNPRKAYLKGVQE